MREGMLAWISYPGFVFDEICGAACRIRKPFIDAGVQEKWGFFGAWRNKNSKNNIPRHRSF